MPRSHWQHENGTHGCLANKCTNPATWQWQRHTGPDETTAVFACNQHTPKTPHGEHNLDKMAQTHQAECPAPNPGCNC